MRDVELELKVYDWLQNQLETSTVNYRSMNAFCLFLGTLDKFELVNNKLLLVKELRAHTGLGLLDSKNLIDRLWALPWWPLVQNADPEEPIVEEHETVYAQHTVYQAKTYGAWGALEYVTTFSNRKDAASYVDYRKEKNPAFRTEIEELTVLDYDVAAKEYAENLRRKVALLKLTAAERRLLGLEDPE